MSQSIQKMSESQAPASATSAGLPTLSIIVPAYNSLPTVLLCLQSLVMTTGEDALRTRVEILVQDDHSPEYDLTALPLMPPVKPARNESNLGFAGNVNAAVARAKGEVVMLLNQDTRAIPREGDAPVVGRLLRAGWADAMLRVFLEHEDAGVVGPRLVFPNGAVQSVGGLFDAQRGPYHRWLGWSNPLDRRISTTERVSWTTGAALMIRRDDFLAVGGLDGDTYPGGYFEDVDLCLKVKHALGKASYYCADATLVHEVGSTGGNPNFMRNSVAFHKRWDAKIEPDTNFIMVNY